MSKVAVANTMGRERFVDIWICSEQLGYASLKASVTEPISEMLRTYEAFIRSAETLIYAFNGEIISESDTPDSLGMKNFDHLQVIGTMKSANQIKGESKNPSEEKEHEQESDANAGQVSWEQKLAEFGLPCPNGFDRWVGGINEMINGSLHVQIGGKSGPIVCMAPEEYFKFLQERIDKECPGVGQMKVCSRKKQPPIGSFVKHIWHINELKHLAPIFASSLVPLEPAQLFSMMGNGFERWDSKELAKMNNASCLFPTLFGTNLNVTPSTSFTIEWTGNLLPQSGQGELCINFHISYHGPIHTANEARSLLAACSMPET